MLGHNNVLQVQVQVPINGYWGKKKGKEAKYMGNCSEQLKHASGLQTLELGIVSKNRCPLSS